MPVGITSFYKGIGLGRQSLKNMLRVFWCTFDLRPQIMIIMKDKETRTYTPMNIMQLSCGKGDSCLLRTG